jgi:hypothetical protein
MNVRITITIDNHLRAKLDRRMRETGKSFKQTVNDVLRDGLAFQASLTPRRRIKLPSFRLEPLPGVNFDKVSALIEETDGPWHR